MSEHEDNSFDTGFSTPVPELDDHRHQSVSKARSRRGTVDTMHSAMARNPFDPDLALVNHGLLHNNDGLLSPISPRARDFEEAIVDEDSEGLSPRPGRNAPDMSRRGTVTTIDPRSVSPPNSVKAFAGPRRQRDVSTEARECELHRTVSGASGRSRRTRRYTNDNDAKSCAASLLSQAEEDICFPPHNADAANKGDLRIDFGCLEDFIAEEENRAKTPPKNQPQPRIFHDLRQNKSQTPIITAEGDVVSAGGTSMNEKDEKDDFIPHNFSGEHPQADTNRFEYFSSLGESTIHAAELGDLILPGEDIRALFTLPQDDDEDGVWWLNMNNPTDEEIRAICKAFGVHPLTIEDIGTQEAREKIELFPAYYFACFRSFKVEKSDGGQEYEPFNIYVVVFRQGTLSFSFSPNLHAGHVRKRITMLKDYVALSSDWICYALIDDIVDSFAPIIQSIERQTDLIEDQVFIARTDDMHAFLRKIGMVRKNVMGLMKLIGGKADVLKGFTKRCNANYKVTPRMDIGLYLGDIQDHVVTMMTSLAHFEKMLSRSHSNYLAQLSIDNITQGNNANKVLSKITLLASILVPLNLVCGMFGMNVMVPWREVNNLGPFFGILGVLVAFVLISLVVARRLRYI